jgi:hypothetical protein
MLITEDGESKNGKCGAKTIFSFRKYPEIQNFAVEKYPMMMVY